MIATHKDYLRPGHIRVEDKKKILCVGPAAPLYKAVNKPGLPSWPHGQERDARRSFAGGFA
jgi:hypothetical protein